MTNLPIVISDLHRTNFPEDCTITLTNNSDEPIDIAGWKLKALIKKKRGTAYGKEKTFTFTEPLSIEGGASLTLTGEEINPTKSRVKHMVSPTCAGSLQLTDPSDNVATNIGYGSR